MKKKLLWKGKIFSLIEQKIFLKKRYFTYQIIQHPGAVLIVPFLNDKVIFLKQFRPAIKDYIYELPAGTLKKNEDAFSCAKRELEEETGFGAKILKRKGIIYPLPGYSTEKIIIYKADKLFKLKEKRIKDEDELIEVIFLNNKKIKNFFKKNKIKDAKTISALAICNLI